MTCMRHRPRLESLKIARREFVDATLEWLEMRLIRFGRLVVIATLARQ